MPPREIDVRISQGCGIHADYVRKTDPRKKPEDDCQERTRKIFETTSFFVPCHNFPHSIRQTSGQLCVPVQINPLFYCSDFSVICLMKHKSRILLQ